MKKLKSPDKLFTYEIHENDNCFELHRISKSKETQIIFKSANTTLPKFEAECKPLVKLWTTK